MHNSKNMSPNRLLMELDILLAKKPYLTKRYIVVDGYKGKKRYIRRTSKNLKYLFKYHDSV